MGIDYYGKSIQNTQDELGRESGTAQIARAKSEQFIIEEMPRQEIEQNIGHVFIVGHSVNGIIGTANGIDGQQITIGTGGLGTATVVKVTNLNNKFIDRFKYNTFIDTDNSTATVNLSDSITHGKITF